MSKQGPSGTHKLCQKMKQLYADVYIATLSSKKKTSLVRVPTNDKKGEFWQHAVPIRFEVTRRRAHCVTGLGQQARGGTAPVHRTTHLIFSEHQIRPGKWAHVHFISRTMRTRGFRA